MTEDAKNYKELYEQGIQIIDAMDKQNDGLQLLIDSKDREITKLKNSKQDDAVTDKQHEGIRDIITKEYSEGNIVVATFEGLQSMPLKEFVKQPVEGMLYDLNRSESVILTFINDPKWVNDYAVAQVIRKLKDDADNKFTLEDVYSILAFTERETRHNERGAKEFTTGEIALNSRIVEEWKKSQTPTEETKK